MIKPNKRLGQHFLHDWAVIDRLVTVIAPRVGEQLVEIGPGLGVLTQPILTIAKQLTVIELDERLIPLLEKHCADSGVLHVHRQDVLQFDFAQLAAQQKLRIFGNLPYQISTPLLVRLLDYLDIICDMHFMLQYEVAARITASPGTRQYGRLSVLLQYFCQTEPLFIVEPAAFRPPPKVNSMVIRMTPHATLPVVADDVAMFTDLVKCAFQQRRKQLKNCLKNRVTLETIVAAGIEPTARPEDLSVADYVKLSNLAVAATLD